MSALGSSGTGAVAVVRRPWLAATDWKWTDLNGGMFWVCCTLSKLTLPLDNIDWTRFTF